MNQPVGLDQMRNVTGRALHAFTKSVAFLLLAAGGGWALAGATGGGVVAVDDTATTSVGQAVTIDVLSNDIGGSLQLSGVGSASNGGATIIGNSIEYLPDSGFVGTDTFSYSIVGVGTDNVSGEDTGSVTVVVEGSISAVDDNATVAAGESISISVLANDQGEGIRISGVGTAGNGSVVIDEGGDVVYTPDTGFSGTDTFNYTISNGSSEDSATVTITVQASISAVDDSASSSGGQAVTINVLGNDQGESLTVQGVGSAQNGTVVVNTDDTVTYTPETGFSGTDSFSYTMTDGSNEDTATVTVTVSGVDPVTAIDDTDTTSTGQQINIDVLANDRGEALAVSGVGSAQNGTVVVNANDTITYTPNEGFSGTDTFTYTVTNTAGSTDQGQVTVTVQGAPTPANSPPQGTIDSPANDRTIDAGQSISFSATGTDPDGDEVSFQWNFGGGAPPSTAEDPGDVTFASGGSFTVTLTVTDSNGAADPTPASRLITVNEVTTDPSPGTSGEISAIGETRSTAGFAESVELTIRARANGQPLANTAISWALEKQSGGQAGDGSLAQQSTATNADGRSSNTLATGTNPETYRVTAALPAAAGGSTVSFFIRVGVVSTTQVETPEEAAGEAVDDVCTRLNTSNPETLTPDQLILRDRCTEIVVAAGDPDNANSVNDSLRELSPAEAGAQGRAAETFAGQQIGNLGARLGALRTGAGRGGLSGLSLNINGSTMPGEALATLLESVGGAAGDDDLASQWGFFVSGTVNLGDRDSTDREDGFDFDTYGLTAGVDYRFDDRFVAGIALGYANTDVEIDNKGGDLDADAYSLAAYGSYYVNDNIYLDGIVSIGRNSYDQSRRLRFQASADATPIDTKANSDPDADQFALSVGAGYERALDNGLQLSADGRLSYLDISIDSYRESSDEAWLALAVDEQNIDSLQLTLGGEVSKPISYDWGVLIPRARLEWLHEFKDDPDEVKFRFANDPDSAATVSFDTEEADDNYFRIGAGANAVFTQGKSAFLYYEQTLGRQDYSSYSITGGMRLEF